MTIPTPATSKRIAIPSATTGVSFHAVNGIGPSRRGPRASRPQRRQCTLGIGLQSGQVILNRVPDQAEIDRIVTVTQTITHATDCSGGLGRHQFLSSALKPNHGLTDPFEAALNGIPLFVIAGEN